MSFAKGFESAPALLAAVIGRASPISAVAYFGGDDSLDAFRTSVVPTATSFSSFDMGTNSRVEDVPEALLLPRTICFSGLVAITNSGSSSNCRWCLRRMMNQKRASEATRTTTTGITIAGIRFPTPLEDDDDFAAVEEVLAGAVDVGVAVLTAAAFALDSEAIREEYCAGSVMATADV